MVSCRAGQVSFSRTALSRWLPGKHGWICFVESLKIRWWQLKDFLCSPETWGRCTHFDDHIFQRGWFNHQLVEDSDHLEHTLKETVFYCRFWAFELVDLMC